MSKKTLKLLNIRFSDEIINKIQKSADMFNEGNFSREVRDLVKIGLKNRK